MRAVRLAVAVREQVHAAAERWADRGHDLALGTGIAQGFATLGRIGFEGRFDYAAIGSVTNLAARLCAEAAPWQVLVSRRVHVAGPGRVVDDVLVGDLQPRGFSRPVRVYDVRETHSDEVTR